MDQLPKNKKLILFDGVCNLCNRAVQYIIKHDKQHLFVFAALESPIGKEILKTYNIDTSKTDSILLYSKKNGVKVKSTAALLIAKDLGFPRNGLSLFLIVPAFIRNVVYDFIAKNRYKWFGKQDACMIPTKALEARFLE